MTIAEWADRLNGREYREELSDEEQEQAKADDVLIVFGASDDLIEFRGVLYDEVGCIDGGTVLIDIRNGRVFRKDVHECDCRFCGYQDAVRDCTKIEAKWGEGGYSWLLETYMPHAKFEILEEGDKYCRGLVIEGKDL